MLCMLTVRRLKPDAEEAFREAWAPDRWHGRMVRAYHLRSEDDPSQVITLGFFEGSEEELDAMRDQARVDGRRGAAAAADRAARGVACSSSGVWNVVEEIDPARARRAASPERSRGGRAAAARRRPGPRARARSRWSRLERPASRDSRACSDGRRPAGAGALIAGGPKLRRAASTSSPSGGAGRRASASSRCSPSMLREPWRAASSRARTSAARASADSVGEAARRRRGGEVAVAAVRGLARDAERPRDGGERLARRSARATWARSSSSSCSRSAVSARSDAVGVGAVSARSSSDRSPRVGGHCIDNARDCARSGTVTPDLRERRDVQDLCDMTAVPATLRLRREGTLRSRAARGDAAAFAAVYERHHQALYRYCRSILRHEEDAQDALQSTMAKAFAALQDERRDFDLQPWLFRIAHNEAISILRRRRETDGARRRPGRRRRDGGPGLRARGAARAAAGPRRPARPPARRARPARAQRAQPRRDRRRARAHAGRGQAHDLRGAQRAVQLPRGA